MLIAIQFISDYRQVIMPVLLMLAMVGVVIEIREMWKGAVEDFKCFKK
jgi:hypothetical protein